MDSEGPPERKLPATQDAYWWCKLLSKDVLFSWLFAGLILSQALVGCKDVIRLEETMIPHGSTEMQSVLNTFLVVFAACLLGCAGRRFLPGCFSGMPSLRKEWPDRAPLYKSESSEVVVNHIPAEPVLEAVSREDPQVGQRCLGRVSCFLERHGWGLIVPASEKGDHHNEHISFYRPEQQAAGLCIGDVVEFSTVPDPSRGTDTYCAVHIRCVQDEVVVAQVMRQLDRHSDAASHVSTPCSAIDLAQDDAPAEMGGAASDSEISSSSSGRSMKSIYYLPSQSSTSTIPSPRTANKNMPFIGVCEPQESRQIGNQQQHRESRQIGNQQQQRACATAEDGQDEKHQNFQIEMHEQKKLRTGAAVCVPQHIGITGFSDCLPSFAGRDAALGVDFDNDADHGKNVHLPPSESGMGSTEASRSSSCAGAAALAPTPAAAPVQDTNKSTFSLSENALEHISDIVPRMQRETGASLEQIEALHERGLLHQIPRDNGVLTTIGSIQHLNGNCHSCVFWLRGSCLKGLGCTYCHLVHNGEQQKKIRTSISTRLKRREDAGEDEDHCERSKSPDGLPCLQ